MTVLALIGTGITLGIVHVLTGPDHLSALATLTASQSAFQSWWLGIRWGIGHSTGLIVVGTTLIILQHESQEQHIQVPTLLVEILESCVGVFMLALGIYGIIEAVRRRRQEQNKLFSPLATAEVEMGVASLSMADVGDVAAPVSQGTFSTRKEYSDETVDTALHVEQTEDHQPVVKEPPNETREEESIKAKPKCSAGLIALAAGIVHGVAGPGGVLGVIPAVQIRNPLLGGLYLGTFCITSTLTMGCFAATYGTVTKKLGDCGGDAKSLWEFRIQLASASLTIIVGIMWLVLLSIGKLEDVFG